MSKSISRQFELLKQVHEGKRNFQPKSGTETDLASLDADARLLRDAVRQGFLQGVQTSHTPSAGSSYGECKVHKGLTPEGEKWLREAELI